MDPELKHTFYSPVSKIWINQLEIMQLLLLRIEAYQDNRTEWE
jgi:hypothetical protein